MKRCLMTMLILLAIGTNAFGQKIVCDKPDFILHIAPEDSNNGYGAEKAFGRFNNDQYQDLVVLAPHYHNSKGEKVGKAYIYYGTSKGIDTTSCIEIEGTHPVVDIGGNEWDNRGLLSITIGDFNNDGYDDLVLGTPWYQRVGTGSYEARGCATVFLSNVNGSGISIDNSIEFLGYTSFGNFAISMKSGDVNGDNIDDLIISARNDVSYFEGRIYIYYGTNQFDNILDKVLKSTGGREGLWCAGIGDLNGDGFDDVVGEDWDSWSFQDLKVQIWIGTQDMNALPTYSKPVPYRTVKSVGDLNNDFYKDIVITFDTWQNPFGINPNLKIIKGSNNFDINDEIEISLQGHHSHISSIRDVNNDSVNDIFVDLRDINDRGTTYVFSGDETKYVDVSDTLLQFVDSDSNYGLSITGVIPADMNGDGEFEYYANSQMKPYKDVIFIYNANFSSLALTYPNITGLEWKTGKEYTITSEAKGNVGPSIKLELYKGNNLHRVISENTDNDGAHKWAVPPELQTGSDFRIKISSIADPAIYDFSDHFFAIRQVPNLKITYPDSAGIFWYRDSTYTIKWQSWGQVGPNVKLELYKDNSYFKIINFSAINEGYYHKRIYQEDCAGENCNIKITAAGNDSVFDFSDVPFSIFKTVGVDEKPNIIYSNKLYPNYPNPFNATTKIRYEISRTSDVQIRIYNLLGKVVRTMVNSQQSPGEYELNWDGKDDQNKLVAGGIFIIEMRANEFVKRQKITLLK